MTAKLEVNLEKLKMPIVGLGKIDILLNDENVLSLELGESATIDVSPGEHVIQGILNGVVVRKSKLFKVSFDEKSTINMIGKYSRLWGNMQFKILSQ